MPDTYCTCVYPQIYTHIYTVLMYTHKYTLTYIHTQIYTHTHTHKVNEAKAGSKTPQRKDKSDRATVEQAIDPRTRRVCDDNDITGVL